MKWLRAILLFLLLGPALARAQTLAVPISGFCVNGAKPAVTSGLPSSNFNLNLIPKCTVTVVLSGTTNPATIYADPNQTILPNPFTANSDASWVFYVLASANQTYDVVLSGGVAPNSYSVPRTLTNLSVPFGGSGQFVLKTGDTMTGPLAIAPPAGTAASLSLKSSISPFISWQYLTAGLDLKNWTTSTTADGSFHLTAVNDAGTTSNDAITCTRTGATPGACSFPGGVSTTFSFIQMLTAKGPRIDVTHPDFGIPAGCPAPDKTNGTDMTCNIQAAINYGHTVVNSLNSPPNIYLPAGGYKLCGTIFMNEGDHLVGDTDETSALMMCPGAQSAIVVASSGTAFGGFPFPSAINNLTIQGTGSTTTGTMVESFQPHLYMDHVNMRNHGGRGLVNLKNAERSHFENMIFVNVRWPIVNVGANENYFTKVDILTPGITASPENFCYNINCPGGVLPNPTTGNNVNWAVDHHNAVTLIGDNLTFEHSSLKSMPFLSAMCVGTRISRIAHLYTEGAFGGLPLVNSSLQTGCYENNNSGTPLAQTTSPTGSLFLTNVSWLYNYVNETSLVLSAGFNAITYDIVPQDVLPGSTTPSTFFPSVQQGQFERVIITGWGPDKQSYGIRRCQAGSTAPCTLNTGLAWPAGSLLYQVIGGQQGVGVHAEDVHFNAASRGNTTSSAGGTFTVMINDQAVGQQGGEVIVGPVLDGVELNVPGQPAFSTTSFFSIRAAFYADQLDMSGWPGTGYPAGTFVAGEVKIFTGGSIACRSIAGIAPTVGNTPPGLPWQGQVTNNGCQNYAFPAYANGAYPYAYFTNPAQGVTVSTNQAGSSGTISQIYQNVRDVWPYGSNGNQPGGKQYWDGFCWYDQGPATNNTTSTTSRTCNFGGPDYTVGAGTLGTTIDTTTNNGVSWSTQYRVTVDGAGHPTLFAGTRYITIAAGSSAPNSFALSAFGIGANQNLGIPALTGMPSGGMGIVSKANAGAAGDAFDVVTNDGVTLMGLAHTGNTILGPMSQGLMSNFVASSFNFLNSSVWALTGAPTITAGQTDYWGGTTGSKIVATGASTVAANAGATLSTANQYITCAHLKGNAGGETMLVTAFGLTSPAPTFTLTTNYVWYCSVNGRSINGFNVLTLNLLTAETIFVDAVLTIANGPNTIGTGSILYNGALPLYMPTSGVAFTTPILAMSQGNNLIAPAPITLYAQLVTASITPAAVTANTCSDQTFTLTGATAVSSFLSVKPPAALGNVSVMAINNGANSVILHICNASTASVTPPVGVYTVPAVN